MSMCVLFLIQFFGHLLLLFKPLYHKNGVVKNCRVKVFYVIDELIFILIIIGKVVCFLSFFSIFIFKIEFKTYPFNFVRNITICCGIIHSIIASCYIIISIYRLIVRKIGTDCFFNIFFCYLITDYKFIIKSGLRAQHINRYHSI